MAGEGGKQGAGKEKEQKFKSKLNTEYWSSLKLQTTQKMRKLLSAFK